MTNEQRRRAVAALQQIEAMLATDVLPALDERKQTCAACGLGRFDHYHEHKLAELVRSMKDKARRVRADLAGETP